MSNPQHSHPDTDSGAAGSGATDSEATMFWEGRYGEREGIWSGKPNHGLITEAAGLHPGRALDLGCGEGADSIWLADEGWSVTGVDISTTALQRAQRHAEAAGHLDIAWQQADLAQWQPAGEYDLVSAQFLQSPVDFPREQVLRTAAAAVATGGSLLVVSHAAAPPWADVAKSADDETADDEAAHGEAADGEEVDAGQGPTHGHHHGPSMFLPAAQVLEALQLSPDSWIVQVCLDRARPATGPDGQSGELLDSVVRVQRR